MSKISTGLCGSLRGLAKGMRLVDFVPANVFPGDFIIVDNCTIMACVNTNESSCYVNGGLALHVISATTDDSIVSKDNVILTCVVMHVSDKFERSKRIILPEAGNWVNVGALCMVVVNVKNAIERTVLKIVHRD